MGWQLAVGLSCASAAAALIGGTVWACCVAAKEGDREVPGDDFLLWEQEHEAELEERMDRVERLLAEDRVWRNLP